MLTWFRQTINVHKRESLAIRHLWSAESLLAIMAKQKTSTPYAEIGKKLNFTITCGTRMSKQCCVRVYGVPVYIRVCQQFLRCTSKFSLFTFCFLVLVLVF